MEDLITRFDDELREKVVDFRKLLNYLADSYFGAEDDLTRIRTVYREFLDFQIYYNTQNESITIPKKRSWNTDYQSKKELSEYIRDQIKPFIEMMHFIIELYEENR